MQIKIKRLTETARLPVYSSDGAGCFDFFAAPPFVYIQIKPKDTLILSLGVSVEVPEGHVLLLYSRSGHGFKHGLRLSNCVGVIDSDFRGELRVALHNDGTDDFDLYEGDRICQGMVIPVPRVEFVEVSELSETERGAGGFGSTGK
jgi:dUTP pyrophosphatase